MFRPIQRLRFLYLRILFSLCCVSVSWLCRLKLQATKFEVEKKKRNQRWLLTQLQHFWMFLSSFFFFTMSPSSCARLILHGWCNTPDTWQQLHLSHTNPLVPKKQYNPTITPPRPSVETHVLYMCRSWGHIVFLLRQLRHRQDSIQTKTPACVGRWNYVDFALVRGWCHEIHNVQITTLNLRFREHFVILSSVCR